MLNHISDIRIPTLEELATLIGESDIYPFDFLNKRLLCMLPNGGVGYCILHEGDTAATDVQALPGDYDESFGVEFLPLFVIKESCRCGLCSSHLNMVCQFDAQGFCFVDKPGDDYGDSWCVYGACTNDKNLIATAPLPLSVCCADVDVLCSLED